jgi:hypothetical protein
METLRRRMLASSPMATTSLAREAASAGARCSVLAGKILMDEEDSHDDFARSRWHFQARPIVSPELRKRAASALLADSPRHAAVK